MPLHMKLPENSETPGFFRGFNYLFMICLFHTNNLHLHSPPLTPHIFPNQDKGMEPKEQRAREAPFDKRANVLKSLTKLKL